MLFCFCFLHIFTTGNHWSFVAYGGQENVIIGTYIRNINFLISSVRAIPRHGGGDNSGKYIFPEVN